MKASVEKKPKEPSLEEKALGLFRNEHTCLTTDDIRKGLGLPHTPKNLDRTRAVIKRLQEKRLIYSNPITYSKVVLQ